MAGIFYGNVERQIISGVGGIAVNYSTGGHCGLIVGISPVTVFKCDSCGNNKIITLFADSRCGQ